MDRLFADFDFGVLDDPSFREDSVREELVAPLLRAVGYRPAGDARVERGRRLLHPFVLIGTRRHPVHIIPDYILSSGTNPLMIIDAKHPGERLLNSRHAEQAYSYAIHPEVRCRTYALCNGRDLVIFDISGLEPVVVLKLEELTLNEAMRYLSVPYLEKPFLRTFQPDLGVHVHKLGEAQGVVIEFPVAALGLVGMTRAGLYAASGGIGIDEGDFMATFDMDQVALDAIMNVLPPALGSRARAAIAAAPFMISLDQMVKIHCLARLGPLTSGEHERFAPFEIVALKSVTLSDDEWSVSPDDVPAHVFSLMREAEAARFEESSA